MGTPQERGIPSEPLKSPGNTIRGSEFKYASVIGQGSGKGFGFDGLSLPIDWSKGITPTNDFLQNGIKRLAQMYTSPKSLILKDFMWDTNLNILKRVSVIGSDPTKEEAVELDTSFALSESGSYRAKDVINAPAALALHATVARFLSAVNYGVGREQIYPYIGGGGEQGGYFSAGLTLPEEIANDKKPVTHSAYQQRFALRASNITGRFGVDLKHLGYDDRGILNLISIHGGSACLYSLESYMGRQEYAPHNVDTAHQAMALHGVAAMFLNDIIKREV